MRPRSSVETPLPRNPASTPSRPASQATVSSVGRVLPRSIWLMYSFENRSPASWVCVRPAVSRSERNRSPRRDVGAADVLRTVSCGAADSFIWLSVNVLHLSPALP